MSLEGQKDHQGQQPPEPLPVQPTFLFIPLHLCVYKVVVVKLLDYLYITAGSELEAQAFRYNRKNIC
jgi:hypothetical protein